TWRVDPARSAAMVEWAARLRYAYGVVVVSVLSGAVGVGLYPLGGTRVWCRFACPMAALLGLVQKFGRYRIRVKEGMCILIPPGDVAALATAMDLLAGSRRLREDLGQAGGLQARSLSWEAAACKLDSIYLSLPG
ncbi:MAG: 4Fe-4S binding protein, partial [Dehalococcoidales bacterium]|nr:4Fe-4S binding protein [Dehalococcoidales bacterium]